MEKLVNLCRRPARVAGSRFERYAGAVVRSGAGHPTADAARRDLPDQDRAAIRHGWMR